MISHQLKASLQETDASTLGKQRQDHQKNDKEKHTGTDGEAPVAAFEGDTAVLAAFFCHRGGSGNPICIIARARKIFKVDHFGSTRRDRGHS